MTHACRFKNFMFLSRGTPSQPVGKCGIHGQTSYLTKAGLRHRLSYQVLLTSIELAASVCLFKGCKATASIQRNTMCSLLLSQLGFSKSP